MEFTCAKCGVAAFFKVTGDVSRFNTETLIDPQEFERCTARKALSVLGPIDEFQCPFLDEALVRALEARRG